MSAPPSPRPRGRPTWRARVAPLIAATVLVSAAALSSCSSDDDGDSGSTTSTSARAAADLAGTSICDDPSGDADGAVELESVSVSATADGLTVAWAVDREPEAPETVFSVTAQPYQIEVRDPGNDGVAEALLIDLDVDGPVEASLDLHDELDLVRVTVPLDALDGIGGDWSAAVTVDGRDSDTCAPTPLPKA